LYEPTVTMSEGAVGYCSHANIIKFIELAVEQSHSGTFIYFVKPKNMGEPPLQIRLLTPLSRFNHVRSLKHSCRFVIRWTVPHHRVCELPVPPNLHSYLRQSPYYDPKEERVVLKTAVAAANSGS